MDPQRAADEIPLGKMFAYQAWCMENDAWMPMERASDGYIAQEIERVTAAKNI